MSKLNKEQIDTSVGMVCRACGPSVSVPLMEMIQAHDRLEAEVAELRKDARRLDWLEAQEDSHGFCHSMYGDYRYYAHQREGYPSVRSVLDEAMSQEKQP